MRKTLLLAPVAAAVALALSPVAQADDAGTTTISNTGFIDFTSASNTANGTDVDQHGFGLDVKRWYLTVLHTIDDTWSTNLTTDFNFTSDKVTGKDSTGAVVTSTGNEPETQVFIKKAYVQGKFDQMAVLRIGSADMPWIPYAEGIYGYRFVENTLIDRSGLQSAYSSFGNSADWGVNLNGDNGTFNYSASVVNGGGYKNPSRSKTMDFEGRAGFIPVDGLNIAVGYYTGTLGQDTETNEAAAAATAPVTQKNTANRTDALVAWKASGLTVGLEYFTADNFGSKLIFNNTTDKADGYSLYASYDIPSTDYSVFGRYDNVKPNKDTDASKEDKYYNAGFAWKSNKNLTWALVYKSEKLTDTSGLDLKSDEFGLWAQVKF